MKTSLWYLRTWQWVTKFWSKLKKQIPTKLESKLKKFQVSWISKSQVTPRSIWAVPLFITFRRLSMTQLRSVTCHMGSHSVSCYYQTQVNTPRLNPSHAGRYSIYLPRKDRRPSWPNWLDSAGRESNQRPFDHESYAQPLHHQDNCTIG